MGFRRVLDIELMEGGDVFVEESDYLKTLSHEQKIQVLKSYLDSLREELIKPHESDASVQRVPDFSLEEEKLRKHIAVIEIYLSRLENAVN
jgi:hypothetical protein